MERKKDNPPSFAELFLLLRTEDKQHAKTTRMKQHLGAATSTTNVQNQRVTSDLQICACSASKAELKPQVQQQARATASDNVAVKIKPVKPVVSKSSEPSNNANKSSDRPRPWDCFQCGEDGHIASVCDNAPNPALVAEKKKLLREKTSQWDAQQPSRQRLN